MRRAEDKKRAHRIAFDVLSKTIPRKLQRTKTICAIFDPIKRTVKLEKANRSVSGQYLRFPSFFLRKPIDEFFLGESHERSLNAEVVIQRKDVDPVAGAVPTDLDEMAKVINLVHVLFL